MRGVKAAHVFVAGLALAGVVGGLVVFETTSASPQLSSNTIDLSSLPAAVASDVSKLDTTMQPTGAIRQTTLPSNTVPGSTLGSFMVWSWTDASGSKEFADGSADLGATSIARCSADSNFQVCLGVAAHSGLSGYVLGTADQGTVSIAVSIGGAKQDVWLGDTSTGSSAWVLAWSNPGADAKAVVQVSVTNTSGATSTASASGGTVKGQSGGAAEPAAVAAKDLSGLLHSSGQ